MKLPLYIYCFKQVIFRPIKYKNWWVTFFIPLTIKEIKFKITRFKNGKFMFFTFGIVEFSK